jgi:toxin secretion/phage lysis holin
MNATDIKNSVLASLAVLGGSIAGALGGWDAMLKALLTAMAVDYVMGLTIALVFKKSPKTEHGAASSDECIKGIFKKGFAILLILVAVQLDNVLGMEYTRSMVILFFIASEGLSILENMSIMGVPFPPAIQRMFEELRKDKDKDKKDEDGREGWG